MREPPTRTIGLLRQGPPNPAALREATRRYIELLRPFERPGASATTGVRRGTMPAVSAPHVVYPIPRRAGSRTPEDTRRFAAPTTATPNTAAIRGCGTTIRRRSPSAT